MQLFLKLLMQRRAGRRYSRQRRIHRVFHASVCRSAMHKFNVRRYLSRRRVQRGPIDSWLRRSILPRRDRSIPRVRARRSFRVLLLITIIERYGNGYNRSDLRSCVGSYAKKAAAFFWYSLARTCASKCRNLFKGLY